MQTAKEAREARRRRILERGSDRLAYITGDASKQPARTATPSRGSSSLDSQTAEQSESDFQIGRNVHEFQQPVSDSQLSRASSDPPSTISASALGGTILDDPAMLVSPMESSSIDSQQWMRMNKIDTAYVKNIIQGIDVSESLRALAALVVAVFVVAESFLSCCGHPWGMTLALRLFRWPLGLVFITDLTVMIGAYLMCSQMKSSKKHTGDPSSQAEGLDGSYDKMSQALDAVEQFQDVLNLGLLCKKAAGALSLDCSIYAVTLVCGLSICNYLFSCCRVS